MVSVNNGALNETFELWEADERLANISFSGRTRFARMVSRLGKRIFSFEDKAFFLPKKTHPQRIRYPHGQGGRTEARVGKKGVVEMDGRKYVFVYNQDENGELTSLMNPCSATCSPAVSIPSPNGWVKQNRCCSAAAFASLLLVLCWYAPCSHAAPFFGPGHDEANRPVATVAVHPANRQY